MADEEAPAPDVDGEQVSAAVGHESGQDSAAEPEVAHAPEEEPVPEKQIPNTDPEDNTAAGDDRSPGDNRSPDGEISQGGEEPSDAVVGETTNSQGRKSDEKLGEIEEEPLENEGETTPTDEVNEAEPGEETGEKATEDVKEVPGPERSTEEITEEERKSTEPQIDNDQQQATEEDGPAAEEMEPDKPSSPLPQSDTFTEGERPETPVVAVTEPLSREGSPIPEPEPEQLDAGTPERRESPLSEEEGFDDNRSYMNRDELMETYQAIQTDKDQLQNQNTQLQHKLAEYFRKKKTDDQRQEIDKNVTDQEQRYLKYMSNLEELRKQEEEELENSRVHLEELKERRQEKLEAVDEETRHFTHFKQQSAEIAINSRTGKPITQKDIELYLLNEAKKEDEVKQVRLENIKLRNRLRKREHQLKAKEELAEGLHLIDFEQLKIENQTYNEKIEERNEELLKLRKKITSTVQVLTHVKEKLQFVQAENQVQKSKLKDVEALVAQKRDVLSRTKKARDSLRIDNQKLRQRSGLLGNTPLLRDFENRKDEGDELRGKLDRLKRQHAELTLTCSGVRRKIDEVRSGRS